MKLYRATVTYTLLIAAEDREDAIFEAQYAVKDEGGPPTVDALEIVKPEYLKAVERGSLVHMTSEIVAKAKGEVDVTAEDAIKAAEAERAVRGG